MTIRYSTGLLNKGAGQFTNLVSNGDFATNTTGWTGNNATLTRDATGGVDSSGALSIENASAAQGEAYIDVSCVVGKVYELEFNITGGNAGGLLLKVGSTTDDDALFTTPVFSSTGEHKAAFVAQSATTRITFQNSSSTSGEASLLDAVSVDEKVDGYRGILNGGFINFYTGSQPASANDAATGTLIATISAPDSAGIEFDGSNAGQIAKPSNVAWEGVNVSTGTVQYGWARIYEAGDNPANASTTASRLDFSIGTSGADMNVSNLNATEGAKTTVTSFSLTLS